MGFFVCGDGCKEEDGVVERGSFWGVYIGFLCVETGFWWLSLLLRWCWLGRAGVVAISGYVGFW